MSSYLCFDCKREFFTFEYMIKHYKKTKHIVCGSDDSYSLDLKI